MKANLEVELGVKESDGHLCGCAAPSAVRLCLTGDFQNLILGYASVGNEAQPQIHEASLRYGIAVPHWWAAKPQ